MSVQSAAGWVSLRRQLYVAVVALGLAGMVTAVMADAEASLFGPGAGAGGAQAPVAAGLPAGGQMLTDTTAMDGFGAWSPDGRQIAFMRDGRIWLMDGSGEGARALTQAPSVWESVPTWKPGGKDIAFSRVSVGGDEAWLVSLDVKSGKETVLAKESQPVGHLAWAPDGKVLYYTTPDKLRKLDVRKGQSTTLVQVPPDWEMQAGGLAVSRDGKQVIYGAGPAVGRGVRYDLWQLAVTGREAQPEQLTRGGGIMPSFSPDGKQIAYRNPRQSTGIYVMELASHATILAVADEEKVMHFHPAFSPDGKRLLISRLLVGSDNGQGRFTSNLLLHRLTASGR